MFRVATPAFLVALISFGADSEVTFVPKRDRVSVAELRVPDKAKGKYLDGERRLRDGDRDSARRKFEEAVKLAPKYAAAWNALGVLTADAALAEEHFRRAVAADPDNADATLNLGALLLRTGRAEEALGYNQRVAMTLPGDAQAQALFGMNLYRLGKLAEAERALRSAKELDRELASHPQLFLAEIYARRGEKDRAAAELEELLGTRLDAGLEETVRGALAELR